MRTLPLSGLGTGKGWIAQLEQNRAEREAQRAKESAHHIPPIYQKIKRWWHSLAPEEQGNSFSMEYLARQLGECPSKIGPALHALGFVRVRVWKLGSPHKRLWHRKKK